ncbi:MAG TPA: branched-chain amino acid transport system II carrier protein [Candidatus Scybalomonas excrementigallinarum]|nr:branched-chain amino acid transport system II carrier protein [Candidatus Scybalomonas excrementigallinarum]
MEKLDKKNRLLMGITLFSMFFGAGNLIFPPFVGAMAGKSSLIAGAGFALSAIGLPILGVAAVTKSGGLENLASRVHKKFAFVYILILYLSIGPCLAIPRTASTSFSMAVVPFVKEVKEGHQLIYSIVFFVVAMLIALKPEKLTEYLGKKLTPCLLVLIVIIFVGSFLHPAGKLALPTGGYEELPMIKGFLDGYQTMDTLAALNFGMIIAMNIREKGIQKEQSIMKETIFAGWIAGIILCIVYGMLLYTGAISSDTFKGAKDGTEILTALTQFLFGRVGVIILALVFLIACLNTCIGLLSCCGKYFHSIVPKISYRNWVFLFAFVSMIISNIGLTKILELSVPVLNAIYPVAIVLIILAYIEPFIGRYRAIYPFVVTFCVISSIIEALEKKNIVIYGITSLMKQMPFYNAGFGWIIPSIVGVILAILYSEIIKGKVKKIH